MNHPQARTPREKARAAATFLCLFLGLGSLLFPSEETIEFGRFGAVTLYRQSPNPSQVVLFVSGDGGWNQGVVDMARSLASMDALVAGLDITHYLAQLAASEESCSYPAADLENLSKFLQKKFDFPAYVRPVLVGYSSGATLVYAALAQAPANTFRGAVSMGFCPDLTLDKPLCKGSGLESKPGGKPRLYVFSPAPALASPWIAFQGAVDQVCDAHAVAAYVKQVGGSELVLLPKVGHGFSVQRNWLPQFRDVFARLAAPGPASPTPTDPGLADLPVVELKAEGSGDLLAVIVTGDGGWAGIDRQIAERLVFEGVPVAGMDSLQYFWKQRTPEGAGADLGRILQHYLKVWNKRSAVLIGYSLGADVLPFMVNRLPPELASRVRLISLLGPARTASFEFHLAEWLGATPKTALPVLPEALRLPPSKVLCLAGEEETDSLCGDLPPGSARVVRLPGGHHFGGDYQALADLILRESQ